MITVKRTSTPPVDLKGQKGKLSAGEKELAAVLAFYSQAGNLNKSFDFKAYKSKSVIEELTRLFAGKCAYCESKYQATQPVDVEHYRPKGGFNVIDAGGKARGTAGGQTSPPAAPKIKLQKPGYYWLAMVWDNLLPACIDCNRERNQLVPDETADTGFKTVKVGKGSNFPLVDESRRRLTHKSRKREEPLILNPALDNPDQHLEFTEEGIVRPTLIRNKPSSKGEASIKVYALQRSGLVQERKARAKLVLAQIERVRELIADLDARPGDAQLQSRLQREMEELKRYEKPEEAYAGMARQLIKKFFGSLQ
ncbi:MAG: hypothetical protein QOF02_2017 [Blastocatellia bacterium]|jgi:hypothetical protein|nr:hypothetical protein [Blastocatellia bacterium]